ncbi:MAG: protein kinase [Syntrophobacteraceae bacterium]
MAFSKELLPYYHQLQEARLYHEQGIAEGAMAILEDLLGTLEQSNLEAPDKGDFVALVLAELQKMRGGNGKAEEAAPVAVEMPPDDGISPAESYDYGLALMDGLFWDEAIHQFQRSAAGGHRISESWELCGDCASLLGRWDEAINYYNIVHRDPATPEAQKHKILLKITRCSQTSRKTEAKLPKPSKKQAASPEEAGEPLPSAPPQPSDFVAASISSFDQSSVSELLGCNVTSVAGPNSDYLGETQRSYCISNILQVGITTLTVELEDVSTGKHYAGQTPAAPFNSKLPQQAMVSWAHAQAMLDSEHVVKVLDVAANNDICFIVREYLPLSLGNLLAAGEPLPVASAVFIAHRILEGLGDLHLHKGQDEQVRNIFHLDLRPSKVLMHNTKPRIKINNAGLWAILAKSNPHDTSLKRLPLSMLAYRAPEQFRTYLARRRPPVFTDIYQFGMLFYEMLTGVPAFRASSYEEYEIQHCDQYPTPPKVWRPEIPDQLNEIIMQCLHCDPMKRWRSATQIALELEKPFHSYVQTPRDGSYAQLMLRAGAS